MPSGFLPQGRRIVHHLGGCSSQEARYFTLPISSQLRLCPKGKSSSLALGPDAELPQVSRGKIGTARGLQRAGVPSLTPSCRRGPRLEHEYPVPVRSAGLRDPRHPPPPRPRNLGTQRSQQTSILMSNLRSWRSIFGSNNKGVVKSASQPTLQEFSRQKAWFPSTASAQPATTNCFDASLHRHRLAALPRAVSLALPSHRR